MFKNYIKIAWRNIKKHKVHTAINLLGLAVAFGCSVFLFLTARYEFSYDNFHKESDRIFKVYNYYSDFGNAEGAKRTANMSLPVAPTLKAEVAGVDKATRVIDGESGVAYNNKEFGLYTKYVDNDFFSIFSFPVVSGTEKDPLASTGNVVLTEHAANVLMGKENVAGKIIKVKTGGQWRDLMVSAVVKNFPDNSSLKFDVLVRPELNPDYITDKDKWNVQNHDVYVKLKQGITKADVEKSIKTVVKKYRAADLEEMKQHGIKPDANGDLYSLKLLPLSQIHFDTEVGTGDIMAKSYLYTLMLVGFFILLIAVFNFINLNIAQSLTRIKEVGVRKCIGAGRKQIFLQVWGESFSICLAAVVIGLTALTILIKPFNQLLQQRISVHYLYQPLSILYILLLVFIVSLFAGGYPAAMVSKLNTVSILKGKISVKRPGFFRNLLIVVQFAMACLLMACGLIVYRQFNFMRTQPLGYSKETVISVPLAHPEKGKSVIETLRARFASQPAVISVSGSDINFGLGKDGSSSTSAIGFDLNGKLVRTNLLTVDYDFIKTMGIRLKEGRDFNRTFGSDPMRNVIVNQSMVERLGIKNPVGFSYLTDSTQPRSTIIGVVPDFHLYSLRKKTEPLSIYLANNNEDFINYALIKVNTNNPKQVMDFIKKEYKSIEPNADFQGSFLDENVDRWYNKEKRFAKVLGIATAIAIVLSCLGVFAMTALLTGQRIKEIGVRKVLGASVPNITVLLSKEFLLLVITGIIIAAPTGWWLMDKWIQNFPYRIDMEWWVFVASSLTALFVAVITVSVHIVKAATANPVKSLRTE